tara:strand:+ start:2983 stop:3144 length:162 start_codon:yes stop_codon:yes gene_type:complete
MKDKISQVIIQAPVETKPEVETTQWAPTKTITSTKRERQKAAALVLPPTTANS